MCCKCAANVLHSETAFLELQCTFYFLVAALKYDWKKIYSSQLKVNFVLQYAVTIPRQSNHVEFIN